MFLPSQSPHVLMTYGPVLPLAGRVALQVGFRSLSVNVGDNEGKLPTYVKGFIASSRIKARLFRPLELDCHTVLEITDDNDDFMRSRDIEEEHMGFNYLTPAPFWINARNPTD
ncbi:hypothetical protein THAOC_02102, partial [Thalassiosira oceanica]